MSPPVVTFCAGRTESCDTVIDRHGLSARPVVRLQQEHTATVLWLDPRDDISESSALAATPADGCFTTRTDVVLTVRTADCLPVLVYHPAGVIGAIHAGRKGTELGIVRGALQLLRHRFPSGKTVSVWLGPHICERCYQVDQERDYYYNLRAKNIAQIEEIYPDSAIELLNSEHCTHHHSHQWYSYRREGKGVPMNFSGIALL